MCLLCFISSLNDSPLKTMKNSFYFIEKALFVLEICRFLHFYPPFFGLPAVAGRVLWNRVCLSFRPSVLLSGCFLGIVSSVFSKFWHGAKNPYEVVQSQMFQKICFLPPKLGKWTRYGPKTRFLDLLRNFVINFYWICSVMKIYIICCVPAQIPYLRKFWFLIYGTKCSQPIRLQDFLINHISRTNKWNSLNFCKLMQIHTI